jgi:UDP-glucose-4-epimerase GalE
MRVLVAGGAGYVGAHTAKALRAAGFDPVTLDDLSQGHREAVRYGPFVHGSIADRALVAGLLEQWNISAVLHFAANAYVRESLVVPQRYFNNNVAGSLALLDACLASGRVSAFVFSSSCAVYGIPQQSPIAESAAANPVNPYGESKLFIERVLGWYGRINGLRWAALRYFNAAGADPDGELGESHHPETHLIPLVVRAARGGPRLPLLGLDHATPDGTAIRDYVHVSDLADAHVQSLRYLLDGGQSRSFNLGTGHGASVRTVIRAVERLLGPVPIVDAPRSPGDPPILVANSTAIANALAWVPTRSDLDFIVRTAADWDARSR